MKSEESFLKKLDTDLATGNIITDERRGILHREKTPPVPDRWQPIQTESRQDDITEIKRMKQKSLFKKMFVASFVFLLVAVGIFGYSLYTGKVRLTGDLVDVSLQTKSFADSGEEVTVDIAITNRNTVPMEFAKLFISYPLGTAKDPGAIREIVKEIGTVRSGEIFRDTFTVPVFGEQGAEKSFSARVEYRLGGTNAIFENNGQTKLILRSGTATLGLVADDIVVAGQIFPIKVTLTGNSTQIIPNTLIVANYPDGCSLQSASPTPTIDSNTWYVGNVKPGEPITLDINMICDTLISSGQTLSFVAGSQDTTNERLITTVYTNATKIITTQQSFLAIQLSVNNRPYRQGIAIAQKRSSDIQIQYENTTENTITNATISARLSGDAYDQSKVVAGQGFFNTANNTIIWTPNEIAELARIAPGQKGVLSISVVPKDNLTTNGTIDVSTSVSGILLGGEVRELSDISSAKIAIGTNFDVLPKTLYHSGLLKNTGPMPMESEKETTFTIVWQLSNQPNPVTDAVVSTTLPTGVVWKGSVAPSEFASAITYNTVTREISWKAGNVPVGTDAKTIAFTVGVTPSKTQIGAVLNITNDIIFSGNDSITKTQITGQKRAMTTRLLNDTSAIGGDGKVVR